MYRNKKGVSPLIATILLIAFAVALGSVIMNWGLNLDLSDKCNTLDFELRPIQEKNMCNGGSGESSYLNFILDNKGSVDIHGVSLLVIGDKETAFLDLDGIVVSSRSLFETKNDMATFNMATTGRPQEVELTPKILNEGKRERCTKKAVTIKEFSRC